MQSVHHHPLFVWLNQYTELVENFISAQLVLAPLILLFLEEAGVPILIPGDGVIAFTGYRVSEHAGTPFWLALVVTIIAVILGATVLFWLAHKWGNVIVRKFGKFIFLQESHIDRAEKLFKKYGVWTIIFGRHIPGMRVPITIFAAISGMRYRVFIASTFVSAVPWAAFYLTVGKSYGKRIQHILHPSVLQSVLIILALILGVLAVHLVGSYRERHKKAATRRDK